jgi:hypothetical protein
MRRQEEDLRWHQSTMRYRVALNRTLHVELFSASRLCGLKKCVMMQTLRRLARDKDNFQFTVTKRMIFE